MFGLISAFSNSNSFLVGTPKPAGQMSLAPPFIQAFTLSAYGYLYQWGRRNDGHQLRGSVKTPTKANDITKTNGKFVTVTASSFDWTSADIYHVVRYAIKPYYWFLCLNTTNGNAVVLRAEDESPTAGVDLQNSILVTRPLSLSPQGNLTANIVFRSKDDSIPVRCIQTQKPVVGFNGVSYNMITSPNTGRIWLDRNLGAILIRS
jgi:hypothetical protein